MWPPADRNKFGGMWSKESIASLHKEYGKMISYNYIGIDTEDANPGLAVFRTNFSVAGDKTTSLTLDKQGYLGTFRFITSSDGIKKMLKERR